MLRYVRNIIILFMVYGAILYGVNKYLYLKAHNTFLLSEEFDTLVLGDSGMFLLNEYELKRSINLSEKGSIYKVMYYKLKDVHQHKGFHSLILPFSYSNISAYSDQVLNGQPNTEEYIRRLYPITAPWNLFTDGTDFRTALRVMVKYVFSFNRKYYESQDVKSAERLFRDPYFNSNKQSPAFMPKIEGESINTVERNRDYLDLRLPALYPPDVDDVISRQSIKYLNKISDYCRDNDIHLYLVRMPLTGKYQLEVPHEVRLEQRKLKIEYSKFTHVTYLDYMNHFRKDESVLNFGNDDHCTAYGAALISKELNKEINN